MADPLPAVGRVMTDGCPAPAVGAAGGRVGTAGHGCSERPQTTVDIRCEPFMIFLLIFEKPSANAAAPGRPTRQRPEPDIGTPPSPHSLTPGGGCGRVPRVTGFQLEGHGEVVGQPQWQRRQRQAECDGSVPSLETPGLIRMRQRQAAA